MNTPAPADASSPTWRDRARAAGIDPAEVEMVSSRYLAYRDYMAGRDGGLTLEGWFRFYRLEKQTENPDQTGGVISGCTATGEATGQTVLTRPGPFLEVLKAKLDGH